MESPPPFFAVLSCTVERKISTSWLQMPPLTPALLWAIERIRNGENRHYLRLRPLYQPPPILAAVL